MSPQIEELAAKCPCGKRKERQAQIVCDACWDCAHPSVKRALKSKHHSERRVGREALVAHALRRNKDCPSKLA